MSQQRMLKSAGVVLLFGLLLAGYNQTRNANATQFRPHSLVGASPVEVGQYAIDYTRARFQILSDNPKVLLTKSVKAEDLPSLGLTGISFSCQEPPLMLIILNGDFGISNARQPSFDESTRRTTYIAYVFDLQVGLPTLIETSRNGGRFRIALNNPNLPDDVPIVPPSVLTPGLIPIPHPTSAPPAIEQPCDYQAVAPTVMPPQRP